jgi:hypothetical protein
VVTSRQLTSFGASRGRVQCRLHLGLRVEGRVPVLRNGDNNGFVKAQDSENDHYFWHLASGPDLEFDALPADSFFARPLYT